MMTQMLCPDTVMAPAWIEPSQNAGVREPSAPKNKSPNPVSAKCTPTDTIRRTSTEASASG